MLRYCFPHKRKFHTSSSKFNSSEQSQSSVTEMDPDEIPPKLKPHESVNKYFADKKLSTLLVACKNGNLEVAQQLIKQSKTRAEINTPVLVGYYWRHVTIRPGRFRINKRPIYMTPLYLACKYGHFDLVKLLVDHGAKINTINSLTKGDEYLNDEYLRRNISTPLVIATYKAHLEQDIDNDFYRIISYLLEHHAKLYPLDYIAFYAKMGKAENYSLLKHFLKVLDVSHHPESKKFTKQLGLQNKYEINSEDMLNDYYNHLVIPFEKHREQQPKLFKPSKSQQRKDIEQVLKDHTKQKNQSSTSETSESYDTSYSYSLYL